MWHLQEKRNFSTRNIVQPSIMQQCQLCIGVIIVIMSFVFTVVLSYNKKKHPHVVVNVSCHSMLTKSASSQTSWSHLSKRFNSVRIFLENLRMTKLPERVFQKLLNLMEDLVALLSKIQKVVGSMVWISLKCLKIIKDGMGLYWLKVAHFRNRSMLLLSAFKEILYYSISN